MKEDTQQRIGKTFTEAERDAIHIAVLPAIAHDNLVAGQEVNYNDGYTTFEGAAVGIVDPFITNVNKGDKFFIFIFPNTITTLRHQWVHPNIPDEHTTAIPANKAASEAWLRNWIENADCPDYDTVMAAIDGQYVEGVDGYGRAYGIKDYGDGPSLFFAGRNAHGDIPSEFWHHYEIVTGKKIAPSDRLAGFSCSC